MNLTPFSPYVAGAGHDVGNAGHEVEDVVIAIGDAIVEIEKRTASLRLRSLRWRGESDYAALANGKRGRDKLTREHENGVRYIFRG